MSPHSNCWSPCITRNSILEHIMGAPRLFTGAKGICSAAPMRLDFTDIFSFLRVRSRSKFRSASSTLTRVCCFKLGDPEPPSASLRVLANTMASCAQHSLTSSPGHGCSCAQHLSRCITSIKLAGNDQLTHACAALVCHMHKGHIVSIYMYERILPPNCCSNSSQHMLLPSIWEQAA